MKKFLPLITLALSLWLLLPQNLVGAGNDNPTGVTGEYNGSITTAGSYDPYTGNSKRFIDDMMVSGSVGAYPLKWTRVLNTRNGQASAPFGQGGTWSHGYRWGLWLRPAHPYHYYDDQYEGPDGAVSYPDGRTVQFRLEEDGTYVQNSGSEPLDGIEHVGDGNYDLLLPDGGRVKFEHPAGSTSTYDLVAKKIVDPYGQITVLSYDAAGRLSTITEPAGRYLQITYTTFSYTFNWNYGGATQTNYIDVISKVEAVINGQITETVNYIYTQEYVGVHQYYNLTQVNYADGTHAAYTYFGSDSYTMVSGRIHTCDDVRYAGPMSRIEYEYVTSADIGGPPDVGQVKREKNLTTGQTVSEVIYPPYNPGSNDPIYYARSERRGDGATRSFQYSNDGNAELQSYTDFQGHTSYLSRSAVFVTNGYARYFKVVTDGRGNATSTEIQWQGGAVMAVIHPGGSSIINAYSNPSYPYHLASRTDERGNTTYFDRDGSNRVWQIRYPDGGVEQFTYNAFGQVLTHRMTSGGTETFTYDGRGLKTSSYPPPTGSDPDPWNHPTRYNYYQNGPHTDRLLNVVDPHGNATWYEYNLRGQVTKVMHQDATYTQSGYNTDGTLAWTADENHPNASWNVNERTRYTYDEYKRVLTVTNPMNQTTTTSYALDWANPLLHTTNSVKYVISPMNKNTVFDYDANFRKVDQVAAPGTADEAWTWFEYDEVGNLTKTTDPRWKETRFAYDNRNRQTSATNALNETTWIEYDEASNKKKEIRPDGSFRSWKYDAMNRLWEAHEWRTNDPPEPNQTTTYGRDSTGNATSITDTKGAIYGFQYDALNRKIHETYPADAVGATRFKHFWYNAAGNLVQCTNPLNQYQFLSYDSRHRLTSSSWNWGGSSMTRSYDAASRLSSVVTNGGETTVSFGYDDANCQIWEDQTLSGYATRRVQTARDADGNRTSLHVAGVYDLIYQYTQRNQLAHILEPNGTPFYDFNYDTNGNETQRQSRVLGYTNVTNFQYDELNRVTMAEQGTNNGWIFSRSWYQYDNLSRETAIWREEAGVAGLKGEWFGYNVRNQLISAVYKADQVWTGNPQNATRNVSYTLDALNRQSMTDNGVVTSYAPNALNQYGSVNGTTYKYDDNFNLREAPNWWGVFDASNRLTGAGHNGNAVDLTYDGLGRCVRRVVHAPSGGTSALLFTYDGWNPILEWDGAGNYRASNVFGPRTDEILFRWDTNGGGSIYKQDAHGNVVALLDMWGNIVEKYTYDAFGQPRITGWWDDTPRGNSWYGNRFLFTGREWIPELGIYDYRNRYYHPGIGRFLQMDPIGFDAGDMNLFRYCGDDPVDKTDPMGLKFTPFGEPGEVHDLSDDEGKVLYGRTEYSITVALRIVPGANGTFSLQVTQYDVKVDSQKVAQTANGRTRTDKAIAASKTHEDRHESTAKALHDAMQSKVLKTGLTEKQAEANKQAEKQKVLDRFRANRDQEQRECKKGEGVWKSIIQEERKK